MVGKYFKIFLFVIIIFLVPNVFAQDFNVDTTNITSPNSSGSGKYTGTEIYNSGTANVYNIGIRYNGQLSRIVFNLSSGGYADANGFEQGHTYTLTMNMATDDWRNRFGSVSVKCNGSSGQELSNGRVSYISYKKIKFSFTTPNSGWCQFVYIDLKSTNVNSVAFTGVSNWNLSSMVITDPMYDDTGSSGGSGGSTSSNQDIIDNNTANTNNIINNQNQNTSDIIENNNQNTQNIINSNKSCYPSGNVSFSTINGYELLYNGATSSNNLWLVTDYIPVYEGATYTVSGFSSNTLIVYDKNKNFIEKLNTNIFTADSTSYYIRLNSTISGYNGSISHNGYCINKIDESSQNIINNNNQNTDKITNSISDNLNSCEIIDSSKVYTNNKYLDNTGVENSNNNFGITDYIRIFSDIKVVEYQNGIASLCFYTQNKTLISCIQNNNLVNGQTLSLPTNSYYFRASLNKSINKPILQICANNIEKATDSINNVNDSINNDNVDSGTGSSFFNDFSTSDNGGISAIITKPLMIVNNLLSNNNQCTNLSLPEFMGVSTAYLPSGCILWNNVPSIVTTLWNIFVCGIGAYYILKDLFKIIENLKNPDNDRVEVMDL